MDNIVELIRKLLALSSSPNEHEAALALAKAQELALKHNLELYACKSDSAADLINEALKARAEEMGVNFNEGEVPTELINEKVEFDHSQRWQPLLLNCFAKRNFCHLINVTDGFHTDKTVHVLGTKNNVRVIVELYNWTEPQVIRLTAKSGYKFGAKAAYILGIIRTIGEKLDEQRTGFNDSQSDSRALVLNIQKDSDDWVKACYPRATGGRSIKITDAAAYAQGRADGSKVSVREEAVQIEMRGA